MLLTLLSSLNPSFKTLLGPLGPSSLIEILALASGYTSMRLAHSCTTQEDRYHALSVLLTHLTEESSSSVFGLEY